MVENGSLLKSQDLLSLPDVFTPYSSMISSMVLKYVGKGKDFLTPTVATLVNASEELAEALRYEFYTAGGQVEGKQGRVAYDIQLLQGMALSSLFFAYHVPSGKVTGLYTGSQDILTKLDSTYTGFDTKKCYKLNLDRVIHAVRVDSNYLSQDSVQLKLTKLTVKTHLLADEYIFVPFRVVSIISNIFDSFLAQGKVGMVTQTVNGINKVRFVTRNANVLRKYADSPSFASNVSTVNFSQLFSARYYAPVVGATSDTTGLTGINLLGIDNLTFVRDNGSLVEVSDFGGGIRVVVTSLISNLYAMAYSDSTLNLYNSRVETLVDVVGQKEFLRAVNAIEEPKGMPDGAILSLEAVNLLVRDLNDVDLQALWSNLDKSGLDVDPKVLLALITDKFEEVDTEKVPLTTESLKGMLDTGIYKVVVVNKGGTFSTMFVTNNEEYLSKVYGEEYISRFESTGVRLRRASKDIEEGKLASVGNAIEKYNLGFLNDFVSYAEGISVPSVAFNKVVDAYYEANSGGSRRLPTNDNLVISRRLFGVVAPSGVTGYYCNVDITKVHQLVKVY